MEIILLILLGVAGYALFKWRMAKRGMRFVRAFAFLDHMDCGASVDEANGFVLRMFTAQSNPDVDQSIILRAAGFVQSGGKQLPVIGLARSRGFIG